MWPRGGAERGIGNEAIRYVACLERAARSRGALGARLRDRLVVAAGAMKVTDWTRRLLGARREKRDMEAAGYRLHETDWEIVRGPRIGDRIVDVKISHNGTAVWTKLGPRK